jgi:hypothetical protein
MSILTDAQTLATYNASGAALPTSISDDTNANLPVTFSSGVAFQVDPSRACRIYVDVRVSAPLSISIGSSTGAEITLMATESPAVGLQTFDLPGGWSCVLTGTNADVSVVAILI